MRTLFLILLLALVPFKTGEADTIDIYRGETPVQSKDASVLRRALPEALRHVLLKFSGLRSFDDYPEVEPALRQASSIMLSFYYRNVTTIMADGSELEELRLVAQFSSEKVDEIARSLQLPLWPAERDPLDIWVVVDNGLDRRIMPLEFAYAWESMTDAAAWRGLPVSWPQADEEGLFQIDAQLLWGGYTEDLDLLPGRGIMIAAARREGLEWSVRTNVAYSGDNWTWRIQDRDLQAALTESLQQTVDYVAAANTIAAADLGIWKHEVTVAGVNTAAAYERCLAYLQKFSIVNQVGVVSAQSGRITFRIELSALPQYFETALADDGVLTRDEDESFYFFRP
ncbi:MAG: DUF2066 domain-containing protein [Xanthomonadales bacterium]|nr:DUF2066 domain-containing protein [Xanthomonadales bacterium]